MVSPQETGAATNVDADGRVIGIEVLSASEVLAPGDWQTARLPCQRDIDAAG